MDLEKVHTIFKRKVIEFAEQLRPRCPAVFAFGFDHLKSMQDGELFDKFYSGAYQKYEPELKRHDEAFFMTTSDIDDPLNFTPLLRNVWGDLTEAERSIVWQYMDLFTKLCEKVDKGT